MELFDQIEEAYKEVRNKQRINSLTVNYKLYKLLQLLGYPCRKDQFYMLKTKNKLDEHDEQWTLIIKYLNKKHPDQGWRYLETE